MVKPTARRDKPKMLKEKFSTIFPYLKQKLIIYIFYITPLFFLIQARGKYLVIIAGGLLGLALLIADELTLNRYYNEPKEDTSDLNKEQFSQGETRSAATYLSQTNFLATRSTLFLIVLWPLSFFVITSTGSFLGIGLVMGIFVGLLEEMWTLRKEVQIFNQRFWSQVKTQLTPEQIRLLFILTSAYFVFLNLLILR